MSRHGRRAELLIESSAPQVDAIAIASAQLLAAASADAGNPAADCHVAGSGAANARAALFYASEAVRTPSGQHHCGGCRRRPASTAASAPTR